MKANKKVISFEKIQRQIRSPDFLNLQISSFKKFISYNYNSQSHKSDCLTKLFNDFFPIQPYKDFNIWFKGYYLSRPLYSPEYCLEHGLTYSVKLSAKFQLLVKRRKKIDLTEKKDHGTLRSPKIETTIPKIYLNPKYLSNSSTNYSSSNLNVKSSSKYSNYLPNKCFLDLKENLNRKKKKDSKLKRIKENIFICNLPYMTPNGSFIFNGYERIIVSQLIKASGLVFGKLSLKKGYKYFYSKIIPDKGIFLEFTSDNKNLLNVILDGKNKFYLTTFLRAIGYSYDYDILKLFKLSKPIVLKKQNERYILGKRIAGKVLSFWFEDFVDEISGEVVTVERSSILLDSNTRINEDIIKVLKANNIDKIFIKREKEKNSDYSIIYKTLKRDKTNSQEEALIYILKSISNKKREDSKREDNSKKEKNKPKQITMALYDLFFSIKQISLSQRGRIKLNQLLKSPKTILTITYEDILAIIENLIALSNSNKQIEELEHLSNQKVKTIEEQLKEPFYLGFSKMLADFKPKIRREPKPLKNYNPKKIIKAKIFNNIFTQYFSTKPFSQLIDQINPLSELTQKRRLSYLGTSGFSRERASYEIRDINYSYYGKLCPIETPEGPNIGLRSSLCVLAEVNSLGNLITPYLRIKKGKITNQIVYLSSEDEIEKNICQLSQKKFFYSSKKQLCRINSDYRMIENDKIDFMDVAYNQIASISVSLIPFLEHDDANRALMGSNMMRQAVPLLKPDLPIVYTGMEKEMMKSTRNIIYSKKQGIVKYVKNNKLILQDTNNKFFSSNLRITKFPIFKPSQNKTGVTLNPIVKIGEKIKKGQVISEGFATKQGELALGINIIVAFMPFKGYNFEDAIVVSENLRKQDDFTSINIIRLTIEARPNKLTKEKFTKQIPNISKKEKNHLDKKGIVKLGTFINPGKIIVGKISQLADSEIRPEIKILRAILGETKLNLKDISVRAGPSIKGIVIIRSIFIPAKTNNDNIFLNPNESFQNKTIYIRQLLSKKYNLIKLSINPKKTIQTKLLATIFKTKKRLLYNLYEAIQKRKINQLSSGIEKIITIYMAEKRNLKVGDKMSGRHGNKGVVAKIVKEEDMPFLEDGTIIDMVLNPLGVPSRMNLGQIYETITGEIGYKLRIRFKTPIFNGGTMKELIKYGQKAKIAPLGNTYLYNGETGEKFKEKTTVGILYMLKLGHMVDDKMHARSIGPYSLITQQPLGGKSQFGGQRFGEMEVWALEAFGASNILQELLTIKSDDIKGRIKTYESIVQGLKRPNPSIPESLRVLKNELKGLGLNLKLSQS